MGVIEDAISHGFGVIVFTLLLMFTILMYGAAYAFTDAKIDQENENYTLVKSGFGTPTEDEDFVLYTGRTSYSTAFGDDVESNMNLHGSSSVVVHKESGVTHTFTHANTLNPSFYGEAATGAAVFAEIKSLPDSVTAVAINGHVLSNDVTAPDSQTSNGHANIAYYLKYGRIDDLIDECAIGFTSNYSRSYQYDPAYHYIIGINYTPI